MTHEGALAAAEAREAAETPTVAEGQVVVGGSSIGHAVTGVLANESNAETLLYGWRKKSEPNFPGSLTRSETTV